MSTAGSNSVRLAHVLQQRSFRTYRVRFCDPWLISYLRTFFDGASSVAVAANEDSVRFSSISSHLRPIRTDLPYTSCARLYAFLLISIVEQS